MAPAGRYLMVAAILGAEEALREGCARPSRRWNAQIMHALADAREHLNPSDYARAWDQGRAMALADWT